MSIYTLEKSRNLVCSFSRLMLVDLIAKGQQELEGEDVNMSQPFGAKPA